MAELPDTTGIEDLPRLLEAEMKLEVFCNATQKWKLRVLKDVLGDENPLISNILAHTMVSAVKVKAEYHTGFLVGGRRQPYKTVKALAQLA